MNWERILMEVIIASVLTGIFGVIAALVSNIFIDLRGYKKIDTKIGTLDDTTLSKQHKDIEGLVNERHNGIKEALSEKTGSILHIVDNIQESLIKEKTDQTNLYNNLTEKQKEIKEHLGGILRFEREWEEVVTLNKELKERYDTLLKEYDRLLKENSKLKDKIREHEKGRER